MPRATAEAAARTAAGIRAVASRMFASDGFGGVTLDAVAQAAGVTRGAVYHHFDSKLGLFRAVVADAQGAVAAAVAEAAQAAGSDPSNQLRAGSHAFLDAVTAIATRQVLLVDAPAVVGWAEWRRLDAENSGLLLHEVLAAVGLEERHRGPVAALLSGAMNEAALWMAERPDDATAHADAHRALEVLLDAVVSRPVPG